MGHLVRFWQQPCKDYRNFQIVFTLLTINFIFPALSYFFAPDLALAQFRSLAALLGGGTYPLPEQSYIWRVLASSNVFTLGFICLLLQLDLPRFRAAIPVFVVLKGYTALGFLYVFLFQLHLPLFLAITLWDGLAVFLFLFLGRRALRSIENEMVLIPRPLSLKQKR